MVVDIKKWFKQWDVEDLLELSSDAMKYVHSYREKTNGPTKEEVERC